MGFNSLAFISQYILPSDQANGIARTPIMFVYAAIFSPIVEELICRKWLLNALTKKLRWISASIISSIIFSALHLNFQLIIPYFFLGWIWSYYYHKSNYNILIPILSHAAFNYIALLVQSIKG
ncbi:CPBP family intramembrane metalloprotease [Paenibacillus spiritus]|uniref:CPBP family intramembrane metalloprotease n=1 Tax=Paenibacillus spiritus TaxID=2496557 RepID=A0A5J5GGF3_9BACL|nr:CPBP family intramembrane metalloprotease [Paenibacillus spiritus]